LVTYITKKCVLFKIMKMCYYKDTERNSEKAKEDIIMSETLKNVAMFAADGSSCGTADPAPSACGSACGASDPKEAPASSCGSACGAADPDKK
jgi:alkaline phosphatase